MELLKLIVDIIMNPFLWFCIILTVIYLFSFLRISKKLSNNKNIFRLEVSEKGTCMVWTSPQEFFIEIEVDRNLSWREVVSKINLSYKDNCSQKLVFNAMHKIDESLPHIVRLYFKRDSTFREIMSYKSDPAAMLQALVKDDILLKKYNAHSIWYKKNCYNEIAIIKTPEILLTNILSQVDILTKSRKMDHLWLVYVK